jgi:hypothetical protein
MLALGALLSVSVFGAAPASAADGDPLFRSN